MSICPVLLHYMLSCKYFPYSTGPEKTATATGSGRYRCSQPVRESERNQWVLCTFLVSKSRSYTRTPMNPNFHFQRQQGDCFSDIFVIMAYLINAQTRPRAISRAENTITPETEVANVCMSTSCKGGVCGWNRCWRHETFNVYYGCGFRRSYLIAFYRPQCVVRCELGNS